MEECEYFIEPNRCYLVRSAECLVKGDKRRCCFLENELEQVETLPIIRRKNETRNKDSYN